ncbi:MAG: porin [Isosphaeraceae bacterium]|nr:porin [Isosphaeraceae bacterium]
MPSLPSSNRFRAWTLGFGLALVGSDARALAEEPPAPAPRPAPANVVDPTPQQVAERLRKLEETNERLLKQFEDVTRQNAALSKTVEDLSRKLENTDKNQARGPKPWADGPDNMAGDAGDDEPPLTGGLTSPSTSGRPRERRDPLRMFDDTGDDVGGDEPPLTGGLTSPSTSGRPRERRDPLRAFYDQDYRDRYGFVFQTKDQEYELRVNGLLQLDSRNYGQPNQSPVLNDFDIPRMRLYFSGRLTKPIEYQLSFQRSTNSLDILNAYINFRYDERLQFRAGRFRAPYTYEWAKLSIWEMPTPDRSPFALNFGPNRQIGFMGWGNVLKNRLEYAAGMFDGARNSYQDFNSSKDFMGFVDFRPFVQTNSPLKLLSIGGSMDLGQENNPLAPALLRGSTSASTNTLTTGSGDSLIAVPFLAFNSDVKERGGRGLYELHASYFYKGLSLYGAWDSGFNDFSLTTANARPVHLPVSGYFVQAAYIVTGETLEKRTLIEPLHPFNLQRGKFGLGALELQARYSELGVGSQVFTGGLADPNLWANRLNQIDLGFNWYMTKNVKFYFDWEHAMFSQPVYYRPGPGLQKYSDLYWLRLQFYY